MEHLSTPPHRAAIRVQSRDLNILGDLGEVGLLDTDTIHSRHFPEDVSGQACRRRLRLFARHGLTQSVSISLTSTKRAGRIPTIHRLTVLGADLVEHETGVRPLHTARSDPPKPHTLLHRLGMAKVVLAINDACRLHQLAQPQWILEYDAVPNVPLHAPFSKRFVLCHEFVGAKGKKTSCWPDAGCVLTIPKAGQSWRLGVLWEYDRSTETIAQVVEKLAGYQLLLAGSGYRRYWSSVSGVRIFFVVPSAQRLHNIIAGIRKHPAKDVVRIAAVNDVLSPSSVLSAPVWQAVSGEVRSILPTDTTSPNVFAGKCPVEIAVRSKSE